MRVTETDTDREMIDALTLSNGRPGHDIRPTL